MSRRRERATEGTTRPLETRLVWVAAGLSASASLLFALGIPEHVVQSEADRAFFVAVAVAEMALAVVLGTAPWAFASRSPRDLQRLRAVSAAGIIVASAGVAVFVATQVAGTSHHGPQDEAALDIVGLLPRLVEVALIVVLARLHVRARDERSVRSPVRPG